ncbi:tRNA dihydrouridine(20/20a) synthase DusA [Phyllobacterium zundukense]|uniref:tRNA-dihydrouridine(20/20a) synthase n=2 Tax=Phyllobacterium zundukense TaxID=1867719 RepID=A0A2N9VVI1_9HYPH|nr:tRNA dihydrouridine(20/20a) synthase DusA [Phyllobacterium zundukense]PIO43499.1 tRNA dihydrouridine(20/20a) synthase DusA [Phyllobacterium zundukense]
MIEKAEKYNDYKHNRFAVAPMIDWTDRHCRAFHRQFTRHALLYTEMVVADAAIHGNRERILGFAEGEHPVAVQLGGSDPAKLAEAARIGEAMGYQEINLNVGCPSDRVQSGTFGACLMQTPSVVAVCVHAMKQAVALPVTVKCRIGVDDQDTVVALDELAQGVFNAGADALWVHARKAWLKGLSPKENRDIPPLDYDRVYRLKRQNPSQFIGINGGIQTLGEAVEHLNHVDGVMLGRAVYNNPMLLLDVDATVYGSKDASSSLDAIIDHMCDYADAHIARGGRLSHITRHMVGLFHGAPGARRWRQILSTDANQANADSAVIRRAYGVIQTSFADEAA